LINRWYVLSAAHCFGGTGLENGKVGLGDWKLDTKLDCVDGRCLPEPQIIDIQEVIVHENYIRTRRKVDNDIALVKLRSMVELTNYIKPVCLPFGNAVDFESLGVNNLQNDIEGVRAHAIGWGRTTPTDEGPDESTETSSVFQTSDQLWVDLPILSQSQCQQSWSTVTYERQVCAGGETGKDSCKGDSGGPLVLNKFKWIE